jgi:hypothetical protein
MRMFFFAELTNAEFEMYLGVIIGILAITLIAIITYERISDKRKDGMNQ